MRAREGTSQHTGFTLIEVAMVIAVIAVMTVIAVPQLGSWSSKQRVRGSARSLADALTYARAEARRSGNNHVVFFRVDGVRTMDAAGTDISDINGIPVPVLVIDDGLPGTGNCNIDPGERRLTVNYEPGVQWGSSVAPFKAPLDSTPPVLGNAITFSDPLVPAAPNVWILFRPDGIPLTFEGAFANCGAMGMTGSGVGGIYVTDGARDYGVVLSPLGSVRVHAWNADSSNWN